MQARGVGGLASAMLRTATEVVIDLDELFGLLERRFVLGDHQRNGVTHAAGDIALSDP